MSRHACSLFLASVPLLVSTRTAFPGQFYTSDYINAWLYANYTHYYDEFTGLPPAASGTDVSITIYVPRGDLRAGRGGLSLDLGPGFSNCGGCSEYYSGLLEGEGLYCGTGSVASTTVTVSASAWNTLRNDGVAGRVDLRLRSTTQQMQQTCQSHLCNDDCICFPCDQEGTSIYISYEVEGCWPPCSSGQVCCDNTCFTGDCCPSDSCSDGNVCTTDRCVDHNCTHSNNTDPCNDGVFCNGTDTCSGGSCTHTGDPCPGTGCCDETNNGCELAIDWSDPPDGAIDARQPSKPDGSDPAGWDSINLTMTGAPGPITADDFSLTVDPEGTAPDIADISVDGDVVTLELAGFIPTRKWTQFTHDCSGTSVCLGYLPADVSNDRTSAPSDILWVIDCLNGVRTCQIWQCDADRSGVCGPPDIMRVIDLLNGAGVYNAWLNVSIPLLSPCEAGGESATGGGAGGDLSELALSEVEPADAAASDADFVDGFLTLLTIGPWADDFAAMDIRAIVEALTDWTVVHTPVQERFALAEQLQDPTLTFANAVVAEMIPRIIAALVE